MYILAPLKRLTSQMSKVKFISREHKTYIYIYICINTHLCVNEDWELLQKSLSEASEATTAQSHKKMFREYMSVRLSSERGSVKFRVLIAPCWGKKGGNGNNQY